MSLINQRKEAFVEEIRKVIRSHEGNEEIALIIEDAKEQAKKGRSGIELGLQAAPTAYGKIGILQEEIDFRDKIIFRYGPASPSKTLTNPLETSKTKNDFRLWMYQFFSWEWAVEKTDEILQAAEDEEGESLKTESKSFNLSERILILSYLEDFDLFPGTSKMPNRMQKDLYRFVEVITGTTHQQAKNVYVAKLENLKSNPDLAQGQKVPILKQLRHVRDFFKELGFGDICEAIERRIKEIDPD
jgi:hypothetical protein